MKRIVNREDVLNIICLEDSPKDAEIMQELLINAGFVINVDCTDKEKEFVSLLRSKRHNLILSDFKLPGFDGFTALKWSVKICPEVPFICVSGTVGEEIAVDLLKQGAVDYILKDRLEKLPFVIKRALNDVREKKARRMAEEALSSSELRYRRLFESAKDGILILDAKSGMIVDVNPFLVELLGYSTEQFHAKKVWEIGIFNDIIANKEKFLELQQKEYVRYDDLPLRTINGRQIIVEFVSNVYLVNHHKVVQCNIRDITERKLAEETIQKERALLRTIIDNLPVGIFVKDKDYKKIIVNPIHLNELKGHLKYLGKNSEIDILGKTDFEVFPKELAKKFLIEDQKVIRDGSLVLNNEGIGFSEKGNQLCLLVSKIPLRDNKGEIIGMVGVAADITERKQTEEELKKSEKLLESVFNSSENLIVVVDRALKIIKSNWKSPIYEGCTELPLDSTCYKAFIHRDTPCEPCHAFDVFNTGKSVLVEYYNQYTKLFKEITACPIFDNNNKVIAVVENVRDITERKSAEEELKKSEEKYRSIFENVQDVYFETSFDGTILEVSPSIEFITKEQYNQTDLIGKSMYEFYADAKDRDNVITMLQKTGNVTDLEVRLRNQDNSLIYCSFSAKVKLDDHGKPEKIIGNLHDITWRKHAEEELQFRNTILSTQQEVSIDGILVVDENGKIISFNKNFIKIWDIPHDLIESQYDKPVLDFVTEKLANPEEFISRVEYLYNNRKEISREEIVLKDGRTFDRYSAPMFGSDKKYYGRVWYFRDITERKKAVEELASEQYLMHSLMNNVPDRIYFKDLNSRFIRISKALASLFGLKDPAQAVGKSDFDFFSEEHARQAYEDEQDIIRNGQSISKEERETWSDRPDTWVHTTKLPLRDKAGKIIGTFGISLDITVIKETELMLTQKNQEIESQNEEYLALNDELEQTNKELMLAKEKAEESDKLKTAFLQNMSHEIRTPMNGILGFAELLRTPNLPLTKQQEFLFIIEKSGKRMLNIINDIVNISKIETGQIEIDIQKTNVNELLQHLHSFFTREAEKKGLSLTIKSGLSDESCKIETDGVKLTQVFSNLISNALKFTNSGAIDFGYVQKGNMLEFYVKDTGIGIAQESHEVIFERFRQVEISAARSYEGAGLGLSISKAFIEKLGGNIWVNSEIGKGAVFFFNIPYIQKVMVKTVQQKEAGPASKFSHIHILIVEDDEICMELLKETLENENASLYFANNGQEAFDIVKSTPEIQIVLMDLKMPVMNGFEATKLIKKLKPDLPVIAQSAYAFSNDQDKARIAGCDDFIGKPVVRELLLSKINKQLAKKLSVGK